MSLFNPKIAEGTGLEVSEEWELWLWKLKSGGGWLVYKVEG